MSVLRYAGSKKHAIPTLALLVPKKIKQICSPFVGGGSFELYCAQELGLQVHASDVFGPLMDFWISLKSHPKKLQTMCATLRNLMNSRTFAEMKSLLCSGEKSRLSQLQRAALFFALNRSSFAGLVCSSGFSAGDVKRAFTENVISKLTELDLRNMQFQRLDFEQAIKACPATALLFLDPPYYDNTRVYGRHGGLNQQFPHERLRALVEDRPLWILCYNDVPFIRKLYKGYKMLELSVDYRLSGGPKWRKHKEVVIVSPGIVSALRQQVKDEKH